MNRAKEISTFLKSMHSGKDVFEIAVMKESDSNRIRFGYFRNIKKATKAILKAERDKPSGIYITANPCDKSLLYGVNGNRIGPAQERTKDVNIKKIRHLSIDVDHKDAKKAGTTDEQHKEVLKVTRRIRKWTRRRGWPDPILLDSGNGAWLIYETNMEKSEVNKHMIHRCLKHINSRYGSNDIIIDESVYNPSRLIRVPGTVNRKGPNDEKHPHRTARIINMPETKMRLQKEQILRLAKTKEVTSKERRSEKKDANTRIDIEAYFDAHGVEYLEPKEYHGGKLYPLQSCPFNPDHKPRESAIIQDPEGTLYFKCFHNSCRNYKWRDFRKQISKNDKLDKYMIQKQATTKQPSLSLIRADKLVQHTRHEPPLISGILERHGMLLIRGPAGIGKSMLALNVALNIANPPGDKALWSKFLVMNKARVLIVQSENSRNSLKKRLSKMTKKNPRYEEAMSDIYYLKSKDVCTVSGNLQDDLFMKSIKKSIIRKDIGLVIIDPLISYHGEDENNNRGMREALQVITDLCETFKVATILIHHDGKSESSRSKGGRGASSIGDWAPNIISLFHVKDKPSDIITVTHVKGRDFAGFDTFDLRRTEQFDFERHAGKVIEAENKKGMIQDGKIAIKDEILTFLGNGEADQTTIVERIRHMFKEDKISRSKARKVLESMLAEGRVKSRKEGKKKYYYLKKSRKKSQAKYARLARFFKRRKLVAKNNP